MKRVKNLSIPIGITVFLILVIFSTARGAKGNPDTPIIVDDNDKTNQASPPWYNDAWRYRRPIAISNNGNYLPYYQVLIKLNDSNFNFSWANDDGTDIRFTDSSGKNPISYWIESWDRENELAYLWVLVSSLPPSPYETTIYLYFGNPDAISGSNGLATFDFFEEFSEFTGTECDRNQLAQESLQLKKLRNLGEDFSIVDPDIAQSSPWCVLSGTPTVSDGKLYLSDGTGVRTNSIQRYYAVGFEATYGLGTGREWGGFIDGAGVPRTMIGDLTSDVDDLYLINYVTGISNNILEGDNDWHNSYHIYELRWNSGRSEGDIDHGASSASTIVQVPTIELPVTFYSYSGSNATLKVDWVYLRQYQFPEPTILMGPDQGLVDLSVSMIDSPDPIPTGSELTYQISVTNNSIIDSPGVVMTDTLPGNVLLSSVEPSQGDCYGSSEIVCVLGTIPTHSIAQITIVVTPSLDGIITNTSIVASPGYELDLRNNVEQLVTLVDSDPPDVNWEKPVHNGQDYIAHGGLITLEASATDEVDQVSWVEFLLYDHLGGGGAGEWISIGIDFSYPFQAQFDSSVLVPDSLYQMFVQAADRAGNISNPLNPLRVIYMQRVLMYFDYLPIIKR